MEQRELETLIEELESRVDRLRALYEQYFMGIERLVPAVAHKDVDRRFYVLRRTTIRNTALRFRFQNVLLKFNTYQTYWMRITRQIEEGTYKRDVRRANARFATAPMTAAAAAQREADAANAEEGFDVDAEFDLDVDVDLEAEVASFEDDELAKARAEVARMRAALKMTKPPSVPAPAPPARAPAKSRPGPEEPSTEPKIPVARPAAGGASYAVRPVRRASDGPPPLPLVMPSAPRSSRPAPPRAAPSAPKAAPSGARLPPAAASSPGRGAAARPRVSAAAIPAPLTKATPPNLSDERVRQIYTQYVETKRKVGESTATLTFESLSRSLQDSSEKLKQKHAGKNVDFEVAVKDGKAVLRPVVK